MPFVSCSLVQGLGLERGHVHRERALALARLAHQAQVEHLVEAFVAERGARVGLGERLDQGVRPAAGGVLLAAGGHVRRAHHADVVLAAQPDVHAAVGGAAHARAARRPTTVRSSIVVQRPGGRQRRFPQVVGHRRGVDDLAGVHPVVRVEDRLDAAHRLVELVAEQVPVELAAGQAVAVLGGVGAAELGDQVADLLGNGAHLRDLLRTGEVDERAHVQAAHRRVAVEPGAHAVPLEHLGEPLAVLGEPGRVDGRVLDERGRPVGPAARGHQQPEAGLADLEQGGLLGGGLGAQRVVAVPVALPQRGEPVQLRRIARLRRRR